MNDRLDRIAIVLVPVLLIAGIIGFGYAAGEPKINDPVAVLVAHSGGEVSVALNTCLPFAVTKVEILAIANELSSNPEEHTIWDYQVTDPHQRVFQTAGTSGSAVSVPFTGLANVPTSDGLIVYVYYMQRTAPKKYANRQALGKPFNRQQSATQQHAYTSAASKSC